MAQRLERFYDLLDLTGRVVTTATDYSTEQKDCIVVVTDTSIARTVTLNSITVKEGKLIVVKDGSFAAGTNNITIDTEGAETIDGDADQAIQANGGSLFLLCDGTNWLIIT